MTFQRKDLERLADIVSIAADQEIIPRFRKLGEGAIREKTSALDLVTDADEAAEAAIKLAVAKAFPKAAFIGEESVEKDRSRMDHSQDQSTHRTRGREPHLDAAFSDAAGFIRVRLRAERIQTHPPCPSRLALGRAHGE